LSNWDVIVIGGGFAGLMAARDAAEQGRRVVLVEARDRLGGRTWTRAVGGTETRAEMGGAWIEPEYQPDLVRELERYGITTVLDDRPEHLVFGHGGRRTADERVPSREASELERAIDELSRASRLLDSDAPLARVPAAVDIPLDRWLDDLALPQATRAYLDDWMVAEFGCRPGDVSLAHALALVARFGHEAAEWFDTLALLTRFADGTVSLVDALSADGGFEVMLEAPVAAVEQEADGVVVRLRDGRRLRAAASVVAVPVNVLGSIAFTPPLCEAKRRLAERGHAGRSVKIWALLDDVPQHTYAFGPGERLMMLATQATVDDAELAVGFGLAPLDAGDPSAVEGAVREFLPAARVRWVDGHDWNGDEWSRGTWAAHRPGVLSADGPALRAREGRLLFAGSDLAVGWSGWIDGAIESGARAARDLDGVLGPAPSPGTVAS
jgi:monoamine oxidase